MRSTTLTVLLHIGLTAPVLADVGYEPRTGALSYAGTGHINPATGQPNKPHPIKVLPRNVVWTQARLAEAFGPHWSSGVPGAHSPDYRGYLESQFSTRTARWLNGTDDPRYRDNVPLSKAPLGKASEWEVLYAYYTRDARVLPRSGSGDSTPSTVCPVGQSCQPPCPVCPVCPVCLPAAPTSVPVLMATTLPPENVPLLLWDRLDGERVYRGKRVGDVFLVGAVRLRAEDFSHWMGVPSVR